MGGGWVKGWWVGEWVVGGWMNGWWVGEWVSGG